VLLARYAAGERAVARTTGQAHEAPGVALDILERDPGRQRVTVGGGTRPPVRAGEKAAEVAVAGDVLAEKGEMGAVTCGELGADDGPDAQRCRRLGELHGAVDPVVVGERERLVAELRRDRCQLNRM